MRESKMCVLSSDELLSCIELVEKEHKSLTVRADMFKRILNEHENDELVNNEVMEALNVYLNYFQRLKEKLIQSRDSCFTL